MKEKCRWCIGMDLVIELRTLHSEQPIQRELQAMPNLESTNKKDSVQLKVIKPIMIMETSEHLHCKHRKEEIKEACRLISMLWSHS